MATPPEAAPVAPAPGAEAATAGGFQVHLENFSGPFDLLLSLIAKHKLDITEVALAQVTDEFIAYIRAADLPEDGARPARGDGVRAASWDLGTASEFLVVAATLLDLKAARLLPSGDVEDAEDLALLEARDLLFARLLQYRAYKLVAAGLAERLATEGRRHPRTVSLEPQLAALLPELVWNLGPEDLAALAAWALGPKPPPPGVELGHLHDPKVSVREQAAVLVDRLRRGATMSFRALVADAGSTLVVVARFLALLELFREGAVAFDQAEALGELDVRWTGSEDEVRVGDELDDAGSFGDTEPEEGDRDRE